MQPEMESPAGHGGAYPEFFDAKANNSDNSKNRAAFQSICDRLGFLIRNISVEELTRDQLAELSEQLNSLRATVDAERYRRVPPSEYGSGLLGGIGLLEKEGGAA